MRAALQRREKARRHTGPPEGDRRWHAAACSRPQPPTAASQLAQQHATCDVASRNATAAMRDGGETCNAACTRRRARKRRLAKPGGIAMLVRPRLRPAGAPAGAKHRSKSRMSERARAPMHTHTDDVCEPFEHHVVGALCKEPVDMPGVSPGRGTAGGVSPVPARMLWLRPCGYVPAQRVMQALNADVRCGGPSPGADVAGASPMPM